MEKYNQLKSEFALQQSFNDIKNYAHGLLDDVNSDSKIEKAVMELLNGLTQNKDDEKRWRIYSGKHKRTSADYLDYLTICATKIQQYKNKIRVLISLDFEIKGLNPVRVIDLSKNGYTLYNRVKYPHRLFVYNFIDV